MKFNADIFKIESNDLIPSRGKILISEPFLRNSIFGRSVVLLIDHTSEGSMGLIMNKRLPFTLNQAFKEFGELEEELTIYKGGPMSTDTLFFIHTLPQLFDALPICKGLYLNGDFNMLKKYILEGNPVKGYVRFFLGYSGWDMNQLTQEIKENTWFISKCEVANLVNGEAASMWKDSLSKLGPQYETWSRFPQIPSLN